MVIREPLVKMTKKEKKRELIKLILIKAYAVYITALIMMAVFKIMSLMDNPKTVYMPTVEAYSQYKTAYVSSDTYETDLKGNKLRFIGQNETIAYNEVISNLGEEKLIKLSTGGYIKKSVISETRKETDDYDIPDYSGKKSWMGYDLFGFATRQYQLQQMAVTDNNGLRTVNGRYCVAVGSAFGTAIGQKFDLVLQNGEIIPCIMGDQKADCDTDGANIFTRNGCCSEFIVDPQNLYSSAMVSGDISSISSRWNSPVSKIRVYKENVLDDELYAQN